MSRQGPHRKEFDLYYSPMGAGTVAEPVVVGFTFRLANPSLEDLREQLPDTVFLDRTDLGSFEMRGVNSAMTRVEILGIFGKLMKDNRWTGKHMA